MLLGYKKIVVDTKAGVQTALAVLDVYGSRIVKAPGSNKFRCDRATVLSIHEIVRNGKRLGKSFDSGRNGGYSYHKVVYNVGQEVLPNKFNKNLDLVCASGIHFFFDKKTAMNYAL